MIPIILCATKQGRAVIYGRVESEPVVGEPVELHDARMVLRWDAKCGGLFGLAAKGPKSDTRITAAVKKTVASDWKEWMTVSEEAAKALDEWKVA